MLRTGYEASAALLVSVEHTIRNEKDTSGRGLRVVYIRNTMSEHQVVRPYDKTG